MREPGGFNGVGLLGFGGARCRRGGGGRVERWGVKWTATDTLTRLGMLVGVAAHCIPSVVIHNSVYGNCVCSI